MLKMKDKQSKIIQTGNIYHSILKSIGWKIEGEAPAEKKYVMVGYPHTSNWDVPIGLLVYKSLGIRLHWVGKDALFKWPLGILIKKLGGVPVDRSKSQNFVQQVVEIFNKFENLVITLSPEGTRSFSEYWRTGFYHIACGAEVPIALAFLDYKRKTGGFGPLIWPSGDIEKDVEKMKEFYNDMKGKFVENMGRIQLRPNSTPNKE